MGLRRETVFQSSFVGGSFMMFVPLSWGTQCHRRKTQWQQYLPTFLECLLCENTLPWSLSIPTSQCWQ
jgi:hypothetical protein